MGRRGPKPADKPLKILRGERADRVPEGFRAPGAGLPEPPAWLDRDAAAEWSRILPQLAESGVLSRVDGAALALYCTGYSRMRKAMLDIKAHGLLIECMNGFKANPAVAIAAQAEAQMARLLSEFGATPAARSRVKVDDKPPADALGDFLGKRKA